MARKILLADDSVTAQNMGRKILADAGYEVLTVNNGSAALKKIGEQKPDLIVLDVYMPGYSGLEVCQRLKDVAETARIPVLLTVGKLEPFKPEEAKRVRADGFIVKPFEASELLSALSKLEDKVVPRPEPSKPGRLARAVASIEERAAASEGAGWKSRLSIPTEAKPKKNEEENQDDPAIYNPVNKDLRTTVASSAEKAAAVQEHDKNTQSDDRKVDLGALAPPGLPADVTPEEIAALAAAAAQVKGISQATAQPQKEETPFEVKAEIPVPEPSSQTAESTTPVPAAEPALRESDSTGGKTSDSEFIATAAEVAAVLESALPGDGSTNAPVVVQVPEEVQENVQKEVSSEAEPVTMAIAADSEPTSSGPRWTAVAVAVDPDEAALSLEQEMQKLYAAQETAPVTESTVREAATAPVESSAVPSEISAPAETPVIAPVASEAAEVPAAAAIEVSETTNSNVVPTQPEAAMEPQAAVAESLPTSVSDPVAAAEAVPVPEGSTTTPEASAPESSAVAESAAVTPAEESAPLVVSETNTTETPATEAHATATAEAVGPETEISQPITAEASHTVEPPTAAVEEKTSEPPAAKDGESELAATTAAAWASWRKIRATGDGGSASSDRQPEPDQPQDSAAMAVAAGAEKSPPEGSQESESDSTELASIVDGILADMRPRIMEEVSKKLRNKHS